MLQDFDDEKLEEMQHHFAEVLNDADAQIIFEPYDDDYKVDGVLEIQVFGEHHSCVRTAARNSAHLCAKAPPPHRLARVANHIARPSLANALQRGVARDD